MHQQIYNISDRNTGNVLASKAQFPLQIITWVTEKDPLRTHI